MTFVCKKYEPMKEQFSQDFHYKILGWEVCDMIMLTYDSSNSNLLSFNKFIHWVIEQNKVGRYVIGG